MAYQGDDNAPLLPGPVRDRLSGWLNRLLGYGVLVVAAAGAVSLLTWSASDPSFTRITSGPIKNWLGPLGAIFSDLVMQMLGIAGIFLLLPPLFWSLQLITMERLDNWRAKLVLAPLGVVLLAAAGAAISLANPGPLTHTLGGFIGSSVLRVLASLFAIVNPSRAVAAAGVFSFATGLIVLMLSLGLTPGDIRRICQRSPHGGIRSLARRALRGVGGWWRDAGILTRSPAAAGSADIGERREPEFANPPGIAIGNGVTVRGNPAPVLPPKAPKPPKPPRPEPPRVASDEPPHDDDEAEAQEAVRIAEIFRPQLGGHLEDEDELSSPPAPRRAPPAPVEPPLAPAPRAPRPPVGGGRPAVPADPPRSHAVRGERRPAPAPQAPTSPFGLPAVPERREPPRAHAGEEEIYAQAVEIVLSERRATQDYLKRRLDIGYMQAADLIERLEREGVIGPPAYNGHRPILAPAAPVARAPW